MTTKYIVLIGTPRNAPPCSGNREKMFFVTTTKFDVGYLLPCDFETIKIDNFYARAAFVFPGKPKLVNPIKYFKDDMSSIYPYQYVFNEIMSNNDDDHAHYWILENEKKRAMYGGI
jgi:hypothetical protein